MATSNIRPISFQRGRASITGQSVPLSTTFNWDISLDRDDYNVGVAVLGLPNSINLISNRRNTATIYLTATESETVAQSSEKDIVSIPGYPGGTLYTVTTWPFQWYAFDLDSILSEPQYGDDNSNILIKSAFITGATLRVRMQNLSALEARTFSAELEWRVFRTP